MLKVIQGYIQESKDRTQVLILKKTNKQKKQQVFRNVSGHYKNEENKKNGTNLQLNLKPH